MACMLGAWAGTQLPARILDIGTGTGLLALMLAQRFETSRIDAVEIDAKAAEQARENANKSLWKNRITIHCEDIRSFRPKTNLKYDLIVSNPPFYENQTPAADEKENIARHGFALTLAQLAEKVASLLTPSGAFYVLLPPGESQYFEILMDLNRLYPFRQLAVRNRPGTDVKALITAYSFNKSGVEKEAVSIWDTEGNYETAYIRLMRDFYLYF